MTRIKLEGKQIGWLTVIEKMPYADNSHRAMYKCRCKCGNEEVYERGKLLKGDYIACSECSFGISKDESEQIRTEIVKMLNKEKSEKESETRLKKRGIESISITLSDEQQFFVDKALEGNNILVDACIGSGKTTAIQYLCNMFPNTKSILYLTYNRLLKLDAQARIHGKNITVNNYHGYAFGVLKQLGKRIAPSDQIQTFLEENPDIEPYDVLIIDEYQDIDYELSQMLEMIKSKCPGIQIIAVGDMEQKIYDKTSLKVEEFMSDFLDEYIKLEFTKCFRLSSEIASKLGRIWGKKIEGVNTGCNVVEMSEDETVEFLATQEPRDILCLGSRTGKMSDVLNILEDSFPERFNKKTVYASIQDRDSGATSPKKDSAIFTTFDSSKGLERDICVVFDYTEAYWKMRINNPQVKYTILRNIFCVAASRGKKQIIFVRDSDEMLSEETISTYVDEKTDFGRMDISSMFDFKYKEDVEECYKSLSITEISKGDNSVISVKNTDGLIDISPCIGIYQEAAFFDNYDIDVAIALQLILKGHLRHLYSEEVKQSSLEYKTLFLTSLETNQKRYRKQVTIPFISMESKQRIIERLGTEFETDELVQVECCINISDVEGGRVKLSAMGQADVVKNDTVYELKFVNELKHEHFLQCASYMIALGLNRGILWNTKDNKMYEIAIPNKKTFMNLVVKAITKGVINEFFLTDRPYEDNASVVKRNNFAVIDTETTWTDEVMSIGVVIADGETQAVITAGYFVIAPECDKGGMYSDRLYMEDAEVYPVHDRAGVVEEIRYLLETYNVDRIMAYNASFDFNHLPELMDYIWCDIMKVAANRNYNSWIPANIECTKNGRMKRGYGVENILRMLLNNKNYYETHNAFYDAIDELKIVQLLGLSIEIYDAAIVNSEKNSTKTLGKRSNRKKNSDSDYLENTLSDVSLVDDFCDETCNAEEAADLLGISKSTVYKLIKSGQVYAVKRSNKYVISIESILQYKKRKRNAMIATMVISFVAVALVVLFLFILL